MPLDLDSNDAGRDWIRGGGRRACVVAESDGGLYLLSLDGSEDEEAMGVVYSRDTGRVSHRASLASHLKMMHGYSRAFSGGAEERELIERAAQALLSMQVEASIGNGREGYFAVTGDAAQIVYEAPREEPVELRPSPEAWERFWAEVDAADAWAWRPSYKAEGEVMDGDYWALNLQNAGRAVEASGANAAPDGFGVLLSAIEALVGGRTFR